MTDQWRAGLSDVEQETFALLGTEMERDLRVRWSTSTQTYRDHGMAAYAALQEAEFAAERDGYSATKHQREVGTGYFDLVAQIIANGDSSTTALDGSTEAEQFR